MKIKDISLSDISRYRGELMGLAILFVMLFHVNLPRNDMFFGLRRLGNIGVDMFFFLSGMGLWFSWMKSNTIQLRRFYLRRFLRIYPTWLLVACAFYIPAFLNGKKYSANIIDLIGDITINWDFWLHDELTFWYIPAIMMLYLFAPFYMELIRRHPSYRWLPVAMVMWCVIVQWVLPIHQAVGHIEIFWSRVPIFFIGISMGEAIRRKDTIEGNAIWLVLLLFAMSFAACIYLEQVRHGRFPLFVERMLYIPLTITGMILITRILEKIEAIHSPLPIGKAVGRVLTFIGGVSLELYLLHAQFILIPLGKLHLGYWPTFLACLTINLPLAWLLSKLIALIVKPIERRLK